MGGRVQNCKPEFHPRVATRAMCPCVSHFCSGPQFLYQQPEHQDRPPASSEVPRHQHPSQLGFLVLHPACRGDTLPAVGTPCLPWGRPACCGDTLPAVGTLCLPWGHPACRGDALPAVGTPCLCGLCCHVLRRASALSPGTHDPGVLKL